MNKKLLSLLLAAALLMALTACGGKEKEPVEESQEQVEEPLSEEEIDAVPEEDLEVETVEPETPDQPENLPADSAEKPEVNTKPADPTEKPESTPVQKPVENVPAETPTEKPAEDQTTASVDLMLLYEQLMEEYEWPVMGFVEGEVLDSFYPGLSDVPTRQCLVATAMMSAVAAEIALVEAEDEAGAKQVEEIFTARMSYMVGDDTNPGGAWYPDSIETWKKAVVVGNGRYVMLVVLNGDISGVQGLLTDYNLSQLGV